MTMISNGFAGSGDRAVATMFHHLRALAAMRSPATTVLEEQAGDVVDGSNYKICNDASTDCFLYDGAGKIIARL